MIDQYFKGYEVRPDFQMEFISLWEGWLGAESLHRLDHVEESEWQRFNHLVSFIAARYNVLAVNLADRSCHKPVEVSELLQTYEVAMQKDSSAFMRLVIPELDCVLTEDWDFTYILWHKNSSAVAALAPLISQGCITSSERRQIQALYTMIITDKYELMALYKCIIEAKFLDDPENYDIAGSPVVARLVSNILDELCELEGEKWNQWRNINNHQERVARLIKALGNNDLSYISGDENRIRFIKDAISPFHASEEKINEIKNIVFEKYGI